jgi:cellulose synthase/poly-beta-1,6-N-acetylglucosamine synthase-like glycosyltransferase
MNALLVVLAVVVMLPGAATALHLGLLAVGSLLYRVPPTPKSVPSVRFLILVPAYNEEKVIGDTLDALTADMRSRDQLVVVADRCVDATASISRAAGALVLERGADEEPGRAAARQAGVEYAMSLEWDAMVMVDADSIVEPGFFDECEAALARGAEALQGRSEAAIGPGLLDQAALASFAMQGVLMPRGRSRLDLLVRLRGTGMVLTRRIVSQYEFRAAASEDLWYSLDLCLAGIRPAHVETARLRSLNVATWEAAGDQRIRYEAGRMSAAREFARPLLRRHNRASLEAAWFLLSPPFAVAVFCVVVAAALAWLAGATVVAFVGLGSLALLAATLAVALVQAGAGARTWLGLAIAPWYVPWKAVIQIRALLRLRTRDRAFGATPR